MVTLVRSYCGGCPEAPATAGIETRARKTELWSKPGGYSLGGAPLAAKGAVDDAPEFALRMLCFRASVVDAVIPEVRSAPTGSHGSLGNAGLVSERRTSCMEKESSIRLAEKASVAW